MTDRATPALHILTGPFHPDLEASLRAHLERWAAPRRGRAALPSFALVAPSSELSLRLKRLITLRWRMRLAGVHLLVAQSLAERVVRASAGRPPGRADDLLLAELVRRLVLEGDFPAEWKRLVRTAGGADALCRTLRELEESRVPADARAADPVLRLHVLYQEKREALGLETTSDPVEAAVGRAEESGFLRSLERVAYYGFYDMTQIQIDLLARVASLCPTTVFLPCAPGRRAYAFADDFLRALRGRFPEAEVRPAVDGPSVPPPSPKSSGPAAGEPVPFLQPALGRLFEEEAGAARESLPWPAPERSSRGRALRSFTASGPEAEIEIAAKEVLRWTEEEGFSFHEIGVVARHLSPYLPFLSPVFDAHAIPFRTPEARPLSRLPWAKAAAALNRVLAEDFQRPDVLEILTSPFFRAGGEGGDVKGGGMGETARRWVRRLSLGQGIGDWEKIARLPAGELARKAGEESPSPRVEGEVRAFQGHLRVLTGAARGFPRRGAWRAMVEAYRALARRVLDLSGAPGGDAGIASPWEILEDILDRLRARERLEGETDRAAFLSALDEHLRARGVPVRDPHHPAVEVLGAMDARGKGFSCLAVMGLQEGVWPWRAGEDPFLGDAARGRIAEAHGVRLLKKAAGLEEERLLFTLALASARERLTLTWQRSGEDGKPLVRSWFLHELARALGREEGDLPDTCHVPRTLEERFEKRTFSDLFWTPAEWTARLFLRGRDPETLCAARGLEPGVLGRCFEAGDRLRRIGPSLTDRDGVTGKLPALWAELREKGWSPTALETYAQCPFRFFASRVLGLEEFEEPEEVPVPEAADLGNLLHEIFQRFFPRWSPQRPKAAEDASRLVESALSEYEKTSPVGYPLLWRETRETLRALAEAYIHEETRRLEESGFRPAAFEERGEAELPEIPGAPSILRGAKIRGRLDRMDRREGQAGTELRVVDYKFTLGRTPPKKNLEEAALQGKRLQPAFYVLLARHRERGARTSAELHFLARNWPEDAERRHVFSLGAWETPWAGEMGDTLARLLKGVRDGEFYIVPDEGEFGYCRRCPYQVLCRKNHRPTRYRRKADPRTHGVETLREKRWPPKPESR
ncbi:MAG: PD-(D/E)XK nuclease family protein [Candidatus Tectomicrobia bacterium]|nr:PD-(D/E)XK nuclease family protein [Candidatus Tectomicrobia bacterium]